MNSRMDTMFLNSENSKTSGPHTLLLNLSDRIYLKRSYKYVVLSNLSMYYTWKSIKKSYKNDKFKISGPTWSERFEFPDESYSVSNIQNYFEFITKKHQRVTDNPPITLKIKTGYYLDLLRAHLEITEVVLVHYNIVNNDSQQDSRVLYTFVPNKSFCQSLDILPKTFIF